MSLIRCQSDGRNRSPTEDSTERKSGGHSRRGWGRQREGHVDGLVSSEEGLGWGGSVFGWRKGLREKGRLAWVGDGGHLPGPAEGAEVGGRAGPRPWGPRSWTGLPLRNLSLGALPLPKAPVLKSPRHLRLQEGKEPEKRIADHMDLFPGF